MNAEAPVQTSRKLHFFVLDGLRGVAALCVVLFHFTEGLCNHSGLGFCHGFLAVDFFFCLSGFVLGYAYDDRIALMGLIPFLRTRLIRLHPMVIFGAVLGLLAFLVHPIGITLGDTHGRLALTLVASMLLIPYSALQKHGGDLFLLNPPSWSLFWEYTVNLLFGLAFHQVRRRALVILTLVAAVILCLAGRHAGNLSGGWNAENFAEGGARVAFSFCAGLLVFRMNWRLRTPLGFPGLSLLLILAFALPYAPGAWMREAAVILLGFPLLVAMGAGATASPRIERLCRFSGDLSYPLYMTHYAVVRVWGAFVEHHKLSLPGLWFSMALGVLAAIALGWLTLKYFDQPLRTALSPRRSS